MTRYLLHLTSPAGVSQTLLCPTACLRALVVLTLSAQPVELHLDDLGPVVDVQLVPFRDGASCGPVEDDVLPGPRPITRRMVASARHRAARQASGQCRDCPAPAEATRARCAPCRARHNARQRARRTDGR